MYLSQLILNPRSAQVRAELARPYEMHRTLSRAFPQDSYDKERDAEDAAGVLFRVEQDARKGLLGVLVQSRLAPSWEFLNEVHDARGHAYLLDTTRVKPISLELAAGQLLAFRLRANPTKRRKSDGKRIGIEDANEQLNWLRAKLEGDEKRPQLAGGFRLKRAIVANEELIQNEKAIVRADGSHDLKLYVAQFDGVLQVADPLRALETMARGIGSGKAFGFGLLSLARAS